MGAGRRRLILGLLALIGVAVVTALVLPRLTSHNEPDRRTIVGPEGLRQPSPTQSAQKAHSPVSDARVSDVVTQLSAHWGTTFPHSDRDDTYNVRFTPPGADHELSMRVVPFGFSRHEELVGLDCGIFRRPTLVVDQAVLRDVEACLAPMLRGEEQKTVPAWLDQNGGSIPADGRPHYQDFSRFRLRADYDGEAFVVRTEPK